MKKLVYLFLFAAVTAFGQTVPSYVPTNGLVGWWPFNGNASDASGNGNNGGVSGASLAVDRFGQQASAYAFNGLNNYITVSNSSNLNPSQITVSVWVYPTSFGPSEQYIINKSFDPQPRHWSIRIMASGRLNVETKVNGIYREYWSNDTLDLNTWNHIVLVFDGNQTTLFRNTNNVLVGNDGGALDVSTHNLSVGYFPHSSMPPYGYFWNGRIDDIGIWNRALSAQEISTLFSGCQDSLFVNPQNFTAFTNPGWANFKCKSTDTAATYQWQQNIGSGWSNLSNFGSYSGVTSDSLVITGVTATMNNYGYRCIVASCTTDTSDVAVLTVTNGIGLGELKLDKLTISPNPTNGIASLNAPVIGTYELLTLDGRVLESGTAKKDFDLSKQPNGVYNLKLTTADGTRVLKIVKN